jgi:DHA3 family macrolide efflux protein-like MFS transporter
MSEDRPQNKKKGGMVTFTAVWVGQLVSMLGSAMTQFGLIIWAWQMTGQATALALVAFFNFVPRMIMLPIAGALVDRWDRKKAMILSDLAAGIGTVIILLLFSWDLLEIWHLYVVGMFVGTFGAFQFPAYSAAVTTMVDKKHYARASGMLAMAGSVAIIFGPPLAAVLLVFIGLPGILSIDIITFVFAISVLLVVYIPKPKKASDLGKGIKGIFRDAGYGFKYIYKRRPLFGLQMTFFMFNLVATFGMVIFTPMVLARTGSDELVLGSVQSMMGIGGLVGGILLAVWGGPKRKINGLLGGMIFIGVFWGVGFGIGRTPIIWMATALLGMLILPTLNGSSQAIWQSKVPPNKQGRVFAARGVIAQAASAFSMVLVGPLADWYFEPAMMPEGGLSDLFGSWVGTGPGAGMGLMILISGVVATVVALVAYCIKNIRDVETIVPDADHPTVILEDYKERLNAAYKKRKITGEQCLELYRKKKKALGLDSAGMEASK